MRPVRWLALRVPALYRDEDWPLPKQQLKKYGLADYRRGRVSPAENRALAACAAFKGDVLIVESEHDDIIPHPVIENYLAACKGAHSLTYRVIEGADHALSDEPWQQAYTSLLLNWATEMVLGAREEGAAPGVHTHVQLAAEVFGARFAEIRVPSGAIANLYVFMATAKAGCSDRGDG
jgi:hypothetical protein